MVQPSDGKSSSSFERLTIDGQGYFLKRLSPATDWIMRVTGDHVHRPYLIWQAGLMDRVPACIDHAVVAMEIDGVGDDAVCSTLMRDVGAHLVPEGDAVVGPAQHAAFIDHLAELSVRFWGFEDTIGGLTTMVERLRFFHPDNVARELAVTDPPGPIVAADAGWKALPERSPFLAQLAQARLGTTRSVLTDPLAATPATFLHGDWKMGNLGSPSRWPHDPARLGLPRRGAGLLGPVLVPRAQPRAPARDQGSRDRPVPRPLSRRTASRRAAGSSVSSTCASSPSWSPSAGKRLSATRPSCAGGRRGRPRRCDRQGSTCR